MAAVFGVASAPLVSISQRMALLVPVVDPFQEMTGVAPCGPSVSGDCDADGVDARVPVDMGNDCRYPFPFAFPGAT